MRKLRTPILAIATAGESSDVLYATGYAVVDPVVFLQASGKRFLVVPRLEIGRARKEAKKAVVYSAYDLGLPAAERKRLSGWAMGLLKKSGIRKVLVSSSFPLGVAERLRRFGIRIQVSKSPLFPSRQVKSREEIRKIANVQKASASAMKAAIKIIAASKIQRGGFLAHEGRRLTSERIRQSIDHVLLMHDCYARETIVACGRAGANPHERGDGPLKAGCPIVIDIFPKHRSHGYWGDITRTVVKGRASADLRRMYKAVLAAQEAALEILKPGITAARVHDAVEKKISERGYHTTRSGVSAEGFTHSTGHGVGLDIHELPSISQNDAVLRIGNVVTIEPGLYYHRVGGIRIEDTVAITSKGWKYLGPCPKKFEV